MVYLIDTSILARLANTADAQHAAAVGAVVELHRRGEALHVTPQVLIEFRNVADLASQAGRDAATHAHPFGKRVPREVS